ncbi:hypothetical protein RK351_02220, partial [Streptococcus pneumoniae]|nr:hypothetical protein [Streptococcus pneumoniae]MDS3301798.1 hypothetical protein [Streptococcus pneumoniae]MDS3377195.1 hypothetical protein [Streptococcus pneumoniae]MDS3414832.1 hypothetical protein [Streptococcus pneumoniae]MDS8116731.1 hypothetical protein [Streptococcus pneumoniae]
TLKNAWTTSRQVNFFWVANFNLKFGHFRGFRVMLYLQKQKAISFMDKEEIAIVRGEKHSRLK